MKYFVLVTALVLVFGCEKNEKGEASATKGATPKAMGAPKAMKKGAAMKSGRAPEKSMGKITTRKPVKKSVKRVVEKVVKKRPLKRAKQVVIPAPENKKLKRLLKALKAKKGKPAVGVLKKFVSGFATEYGSDEDAGDDAPVKVIEVRSGEHLHGLFVLPYVKNGDICMEGTEVFSIVQPEGSTYLKVKRLESFMFRSKKVTIALSPHFAVTKAFIVRYTLEGKALCSMGQEDKELLAHGITYARLFKMGKYRMAPYKKWIAEKEEIEPGSLKGEKTTFTWHKGEDADTYYLAVSMAQIETSYETAADADGSTSQCERYVSAVRMPKTGYWKYLSSKKLKKLRATVPGLKALPKVRAATTTKACEALY